MLFDMDWCSHFQSSRCIDKLIHYRSHRLLQRGILLCREEVPLCSWSDPVILQFCTPQHSSHHLLLHLIQTIQHLKLMILNLTLTMMIPIRHVAACAYKGGYSRKGHKEWRMMVSHPLFLPFHLFFPALQLFFFTAFLKIINDKIF